MITGGIVMQTLKFEPSWDKALSNKDRELIADIFTESSFQDETDTVKLTPIWHAKNYKDELLITVLIHNFTDQTMTFHNTTLAYIETDQTIAEHSFTLPALVIEPKSSMPWTFIFPVDSQKATSTLVNGTLQIISS